METVHIKGLRELRDALTRTIPAEMQGKVLQKALSAGTRVTLAAARVNAPTKRGILRRAIYATRDKLNSKTAFESRVISVRSGKKEQKRSRDAYYWRWVEFGHRIATKSSGRLRKLGRASGKGYAGVTGFVPPQPFLRPAFESTKYQAFDAIRAKLATLLEEAARKARWR